MSFASSLSVSLSLKESSSIQVSELFFSLPLRSLWVCCLHRRALCPLRPWWFEETLYISLVRCVCFSSPAIFLPYKDKKRLAKTTLFLFALPFLSLICQFILSIQRFCPTVSKTKTKQNKKGKKNREKSK